MSKLAIRGLAKSFGNGSDAVQVLRDLDLTVPEGSLAAVLGSSGCGKTTLLRIVAGFETADRGVISLGGQVVAEPGRQLPPERRRVGMVPQDGALFPHLTVADNVGFGLDRAKRRSGRVAEMLDLVGLAGYGGRMPYELSGGQQQRVALARALAPQPALILLDEPFSALDTGLRAAVREDVRSALRAAGATAVLVTHDQEEALSMADLVAVMHDGRIAQCASPAELYLAPSDLAVATFVGDAVVLEAVASGGVAESILGRLDLRESVVPGRGRVVIRPEQVIIGTPAAGVAATVTGATYYGHDALVRLRVQMSEEVQVAARLQGSPDHLPVGSEVGLRVVGPVPFYPTS